MSGYTQMSEFDWMYQTSPPGDSAYCLAMIGDRCNWPRGKVNIPRNKSFLIFDLPCSKLIDSAAATL